MTFGYALVSTTDQSGSNLTVGTPPRPSSQLGKWDGSSQEGGAQPFILPSQVRPKELFGDQCIPHEDSLLAGELRNVNSLKGTDTCQNS